MGAATVQIRAGTGPTVTWANAEASPIKYSLVESISDTSAPVPVPTTAGINYSWLRYLVPYVTSPGTTNINNRTIHQASSPTAGLAYFWKDVPVGSYAQPSSANRPVSGGSNGATPAGFTAMTTSPVQYDNTTAATSSTGPNGDMIAIAMGVSGNYAGDPGTAIGLPDLIFAYDEF